MAEARLWRLALVRALLLLFAFITVASTLLPAADMVLEMQVVLAEATNLGNPRQRT